MTLANDAAAAYQLALRYHVSGDPSFAAAAARILDAWASTLTAFTGDSNVDLRAGLYGYQLACAGELLRGYAQWDPTALQQLLTNVFYPINSDFLQRHNDACDGNYWANWDLATMASMIAIGVFADRRDIFNQAVDYFRNGAGQGSIGNAVLYVHPDGSGQWQESGRDQGHATLGPDAHGRRVRDRLESRRRPLRLRRQPLPARRRVRRFLQSRQRCAVRDVHVLFRSAGIVSGRRSVDDLRRPRAASSARAGTCIFNHYVNRMGLAAPFTAQYAAATAPRRRRWRLRPGQRRLRFAGLHHAHAHAGSDRHRRRFRTACDRSSRATRSRCRGVDRPTRPATDQTCVRQRRARTRRSPRSAPA